MVTIEDLSALDLLQWWRGGRRVGVHLGCSQSTVSRRVAHCARVFSLRLVRRQGEWQLRRPNRLLEMERRVHQRYRLLGGAALRLEASGWFASMLALPAPPGWITGGFDDRGPERPLQLLGERVIDAWLAPDAPPALAGTAAGEAAAFTCLQLLEWSHRAPLVNAAPVLVVCRELADEAAIEALLALLRSRCAAAPAEQPLLALA